MIQLGSFHTLPVQRLTDFGAFLGADEMGEVLLPRRYVTDDLKVGDFIRVFLHMDSEDRPVATTDTPKVVVGEFAFLKVTSVTKFGAFLDWGLGKDLLVPFGEQQRPMEEGRSYLVHVYLNVHDGRLAASSKIDKFLDKTPPHYKAGQAVDLIVANTTDLGFKAIVNHRHWGVLFSDEVFQRLSFGQPIKGFIKRVRPDGKIDLSLQSTQDVRDKNADTILRYLELNDGFSPIYDKSSPEQISRAFGMSKAAFKRTVGNLYKQGVIDLEDTGIRLKQ